MLRRTLAWSLIAVCAFLAGWMMFHHQTSRPASFLLPASRASLRSSELPAVSWPDGSVNPNTASLKELDSLPGVGPITALSIIEERQRNGAFVFPEDLLAVKGIGPATLEALREHLCLPIP